MFGKSKVTKDLIEKILLAISVSYGILFTIEILLPGLVTEVFNLNFLLVAIIFLLVLLVFYFEADDLREKKEGYFYKFSLIILIILLLCAGIISLYKAYNNFLTIFLIGFVLVKVLWYNLE